MTENEAINEIHRLCCNESQWYPKGERNCKDNCIYGENYCAFQIAIKALEEVQEYRKLGAVEEVREAVEKTNAMNPEISFVSTGTKYVKCPKCKLTTVIYSEMIVRYCPKCGQRLEAE